MKSIRAFGEKHGLISKELTRSRRLEATPQANAKFNEQLWRRGAAKYWEVQSYSHTAKKSVHVIFADSLLRDERFLNLPLENCYTWHDTIWRYLSMLGCQIYVWQGADKPIARAYSPFELGELAKGTPPVSLSHQEIIQAVSEHAEFDNAEIKIFDYFSIQALLDDMGLLSIYYYDDRKIPVLKQSYAFKDELPNLYLKDFRGKDFFYETQLWPEDFQCRLIADGNMKTLSIEMIKKLWTITKSIYISSQPATLENPGIIDRRSHNAHKLYELFLELISHKWPKLTDVYLDITLQTTVASMLRDLARRNPQIENLTLSEECEINDIAVFFPFSNSNLKSLTFVMKKVGDSFSFSDWYLLGERLPQLTELNLRKEIMSDKEILMILSTLPNLKKLTLRCGKIINKLLEPFPGFPLVELTISCSQDLEERALHQLLVSFNELKKLHFIFVRYRASEQLVDLATLQLSLEVLTTKDVELKGSASQWNRLINKLVTNSTNTLIELQLRNSMELNWDEFNIPGEMPKLQKLILQSDLDIDSWENLSKSKKLTHLEIYDDVTREALNKKEVLSDKALHFHALTTVYITKINQHAAAAIFKSPTLKTLKLLEGSGHIKFDKEPEFSLPSLEFLAVSSKLNPKLLNDCPQLVELQLHSELRENQNILRLNELPHLQHISVTNTALVDNLVNLLSIAPNCLSLEMSTCRLLLTNPTNKLPIMPLLSLAYVRMSYVSVDDYMCPFATQSAFDLMRYFINTKQLQIENKAPYDILSKLSWPQLERLAEYKERGAALNSLMKETLLPKLNCHDYHYEGFKQYISIINKNQPLVYNARTQADMLHEYYQPVGTKLSLTPSVNLNLSSSAYEKIAQNSTEDYIHIKREIDNRVEHADNHVYQLTHYFLAKKPTFWNYFTGYDQAPTTPNIYRLGVSGHQSKKSMVEVLWVDNLRTTYEKEYAYKANYYYGQKKLSLISGIAQNLPSLSQRDDFLVDPKTSKIMLAKNNDISLVTAYDKMARLYEVTSQSAAEVTVGFIFKGNFSAYPINNKSMMPEFLDYLHFSADENGNLILHEAVKTDEETFIHSVRAAIKKFSKPGPHQQIKIPDPKLDLVGCLNGMMKYKVGACRHRTDLFQHLMDTRKIQKWVCMTVDNGIHSFTELSDGVTAYRIEHGGYEVSPENIKELAMPEWQDKVTQSKPEEMTAELKVTPSKLDEIKTQPTITTSFDSKKNIIAVSAAEIKKIESSSVSHLDLFKNNLLAKLKKALAPQRFANNLLLYGTNASHIELIEYHLSQWMASQKQAYYYLDDLSDIPEGDLERLPFSLANFLQTKTGGVLVINLASLKDAKMSRNSIFDSNKKRRRINNIVIPEKMQIIGLLPKGMQQDFSKDLFRRFLVIEEVPMEVALMTDPLDYLTAAENADLSMDFFAGDDWQTRLADIHFDKIKSLEIVNGPWHDKEFRRVIRLLVAENKIIYKRTHDYDFAKELKSVHIEKTTNDNVQQAQVILNLATMIDFIRKPGKIMTHPSLFAQHAKGELCVRVTQCLKNKAQWARLFHEASLYQVTLKLILDPGVSIPSSSPPLYVSSSPPLEKGVGGIFTLNAPTSASPEEHINSAHVSLVNSAEIPPPPLLQRGDNKKEGYIVEVSHFENLQLDGLTTIISADPKQTLEKLITAKIADFSNIFPITESHYYLNVVECYDVIEADTLKISVKLGEIGQRLAAGKTVVLYGDLATELLLELESLTLRQLRFNGQLLPAGQLIIVSSKQYRSSVANVCYLDTMIQPTPVKILATEKKSELSRFNLTQDKIAQYQAVFIEGETAVGKTTFIFDEYTALYKAEYREAVKLFTGFTQLPAYLEYAKANPKIACFLFMDEANLEQPGSFDTLETFFDLLRPGVLLNEFYSRQRNMNLIFAGNANHYAGRKSHPFFERHPEIRVHFETLPRTYSLYELTAAPQQHITQNWLNIEDSIKLNKALTQRNREKIALRLASLWKNHATVFKSLEQAANFAMCQELNGLMNETEYQQLLSKLFLDQKIFSALNQQIHGNLMNFIESDLRKEKRFVLTHSRKKIITDLLALLDICEMRQHLPTLAKLGNRGVILIGESCIGKSEILHGLFAALKIWYKDAEGYTPILLHADDPQLKEKLHQAFHQGRKVIIDEINTAPIEDCLNCYLSGRDAEGKPPTKEGFLLIGTANPSTYKGGRVKFSRALMNRCQWLEVHDYAPDELREILLSNNVRERDIPNWIKLYYDPAQQYTLDKLLREADSYKVSALQANSIFTPQNDERIRIEEPISTSCLLM